jgi:hypothetical protein
MEGVGGVAGMTGLTVTADSVEIMSMREQPERSKMTMVIKGGANNQILTLSCGQEGGCTALARVFNTFAMRFSFIELPFAQKPPLW